MRLHTNVFLFLTLAIPCIELQAIKWSDAEVASGLLQTSIGSVIVVDLGTEEVLYSKNSQKKVHPASTMKIATLLLAEQKLRDRLEEQVTITKEMIASISPSKKKEKNYDVSPHLIEMGSSHAGLKLGEQMSIRDLFAAAMIVSANDACNALAVTASGTLDKFVSELNTFVKSQGCKNTHFVNAHGLFHPKHVTTPRDLAILAIATRKNPFLLSLAEKKVFSRPKTNIQPPVVYAASNTLLRSNSPDYYSKAYGLKTGFTTASGSHILALAKNHQRDLLVVAMHCGKNSRAKTRSIFDFFFSETRQKKCLIKSKLPLFKHKNPNFSSVIRAHILEDLYSHFYSSQDKELQVRVYWEDLNPPVVKGGYVGYLKLLDQEGTVHSKVNLYAHSTISPSHTFRVRQLMHKIATQYHSIYAWLASGILPIITLGYLRLSKGSR